MENYPVEAFAELGAWYYDSPKTRKMLFEIYPQWHLYFENLK
jgi:hypothetical protein